MNEDKQDLQGFTMAVQEHLRGLRLPPNPVAWGIEDITLAQQIINRERNTNDKSRSNQPAQET